MIIGYARTSTADQEAGLAAQERDLAAVGAEKVFAEQASSVARRDGLEQALDYLREGDQLTVTKLDRLARSIRDLMDIVERVNAKGASLRILAMDLDTASATGKLMLGILGSVAEFEREIMLERQREGIAKAKAEGKYKGRAPTAQRQASEVLRLLGSGMTEVAVADALGISRSSVQRIKRTPVA
ncbi:recombinase family protein [uncultured Maricaulis sp.]|uniref:recombinase family protein n=1 Tax=uncultured Maricaulis sp. TaxID=174710 RepID=UPI0030DA58C2|tara:strand:- start:34750 stop:35304 length:555 start_codon:yes stop_codon:yes gene_type:complete